ncbi:helix-turn-helix domain-containing protein [Alkalicoccobacillus plakortidis]|uniref:XRE family transcriptional regulator n=1 Tax=Alkalicoccobacillus plakortidis TaxID=444060 RepID=A0ABT0XEF4_9BACI|nr:XRE family transcriptional regulator [Alkalicoccobacillus plakortidis]MCM2674271.1 XRE family transcriptional regulator [Alkalicoccobacillus plakortidis]
MTTHRDEKQLANQIGAMLRKVRTEKHLSLQELADQSSVSTLTLGNIERGEANPSLAVIWKIANALRIPISSLLQEAEEIVVSRSHTGSRVYSPGEVCLLEPMFDDRVYGPVEVHRAFLKPNSTYSPGEHQTGVVEYVTVMKGDVTVLIEGQSTQLATYDAVKFEADVEHAYVNNTNEEAVLHFVMTYSK